MIDLDWAATETQIDVATTSSNIGKASVVSVANNVMVKRRRRASYVKRTALEVFVVTTTDASADVLPIETGEQALSIGNVGLLPYDDDPDWNASLAKSLDALQRLANKARKDHEDGRTVELDPDTL